MLAIDIGNTNVKLGTFDGDQLTATWRLETDAVRMPDEYAALLDWLLKRRGLVFTDIEGVSLSSTVPATVQYDLPVASNTPVALTYTPSSGSFASPVTSVTVNADAMSAPFNVTATILMVREDEGRARMTRAECTAGPVHQRDTAILHLARTAFAAKLLHRFDHQEHPAHHRMAR